MTLTAVQQDKIRQTGKARIILCCIMPQPAGQCLFHAGIVVLCGMLFHAKPLICFLLRSAVFKHDHAADHRGGGQVGDIIRLNILRRLGKSQDTAQFLQRLHFPARSVKANCQFFVGVVPGELHKLAERSTLRHSDAHPESGKAGKQLFVHFLVRHRKFQHNVFGDICPVMLIILCQIGVHDFLP